MKRKWVRFWAIRVVASEKEDGKSTAVKSRKSRQGRLIAVRDRAVSFKLEIRVDIILGEVEKTT